MSYNKTIFVNGNSPAINDTNLNNTENQVESLSNAEVSEIEIISNVQTIPDTQLYSTSKVGFEGLSIVNPVDYSNVAVDAGSTLNPDGSVDLVQNGGSEFLTFNNCNFKPNIIYTLFMSVKSSDSYIANNTILVGGFITLANELFSVLSNGLTRVVFTTNSPITQQQVAIALAAPFANGETLTIAGDGNGKPLVYAIEGDVAIEDAPQFFEGIKDYDEIITSTGKNLFDKNSVNQGFKVSTSTGELVADDDFITSDFIGVKTSESYIKTVNLRTNAYYDANKIFISADSGGAISTPSNCKYIRVVLSESLDAADLNTFQVEKGTVATMYEKYKSSSIRATGASVPVIADTESVKNVEKYTLLSADLLSLNTSLVNVDLIFAKFPIDCVASTDGDGVDQMAIVNGYTKVEFANRDVLGNDNMWYGGGAQDLVFVVAKATYANIGDARIDIVDVKQTNLNYQLATPLKRTDSLVLPVYPNGQVSVAYRPTSLTLTNIADNEAGTREGLVDAVGDLINNLPDIRRNLVLDSDNWVDDTSNDNRPFWYYEIELNVTVDDIPGFAVDPLDKRNGKASTLTNDIESFSGYVRIYSLAQPSQNFVVDVLGVK